jgi:hypothetical protein
MGYQKWNALELQRLKHLCNSSPSKPNWKEIAKQFEERTAKGLEEKAVREGFYIPPSRAGSGRFPWPPEQVDFLFQLCETGLYTLPEVERRLRLASQKRGWPARTSGTIYDKARQAGFSFERTELAEWLTISAIATGLGHKSRETAWHWVVTGQLPSVGGESPRDPYRVRLHHFVAFALRNPAKVANHQITPEGTEWLLRLISEIAVKKHDFIRRTA